MKGPVDGEPAYSTVCKVLHDRLHFKSKRLTSYASQRDALKCAEWATWFHSKYTADQIVCVDET